jgi:hypothetical protein
MSRSIPRRAIKSNILESSSGVSIGPPAVTGTAEGANIDAEPLHFSRNPIPKASYFILQDESVLPSIR